MLVYMYVNMTDRPTANLIVGGVTVRDCELKFHKDGWSWYQINLSLFFFRALTAADKNC